MFSRLNEVEVHNFHSLCSAIYTDYGDPYLGIGLERCRYQGRDVAVIVNRYLRDGIYVTQPIAVLADAKIQMQLESMGEPI